MGYMNFWNFAFFHPGVALLMLVACTWCLSNIFKYLSKMQWVIGSNNKIEYIE